VNAVCFGGYDPFRSVIEPRRSLPRGGIGNGVVGIRPRVVVIATTKHPVRPCCSLTDRTSTQSRAILATLFLAWLLLHRPKDTRSE